MSIHLVSHHGRLLTVFEFIALFLNLGWWVISGRCAAPPPAISAPLASTCLVYGRIGAHMAVQPVKCL